MGDPVDGDGQEPGYAAITSSTRLGGRVAGADRLGVEDEPRVDVAAAPRRSRRSPGRPSAGSVSGSTRRRRSRRARMRRAASSSARRRGVVGELGEQDAQEPVHERGDVALERVDPAVLGAAAGERLGEGVLAVVVDGRRSSFSFGPSGPCSGSVPGGDADELVGAPEEPGEERRDPPAQDVEPAADADAGRGEEDLERRDGADEEPAERRGAEGEGDGAEADEGGAQGLGEAGRVLVLELGRRARGAGPGGRPARRGPAGRSGCRTRPRRPGSGPTRTASQGSASTKAAARTTAETPAPKRWPRGSIRRAGGVRMDTGGLRGRGGRGDAVAARGGAARGWDPRGPREGAGGQRATATVPRAGTRRGQEQQVPLGRRRSRVVMGESIAGNARVGSGRRGAVGRQGHVRRRAVPASRDQPAAASTASRRRRSVSGTEARSSCSIRPAARVARPRGSTSARTSIRAARRAERRHLARRP